jgi:amino acid permease
MPPTAHVSRISAAITIFACTISGGLLTLPAVFSSASLLVSLLLVLFSAVTTFCSLLALVILSEMYECVGYGNLVGVLFGSNSKHIINLTIGLFLVGVIGSSFIVVQDFFLEEFPRYSKLATICAGVIVLGLSMPQKMGALSLAASFSMLSFSFLVVTLVYYGTIEITSNMNTTVPWLPSRKQTFMDHISVAATAIPVILYAFGCQIQIFDIYESIGRTTSRGLKEAKTRKTSFIEIRYFVPVMLAAVTLMVLLFSFTGIFGILSFPNQVIEGDVLKNLESKGIMGSIARGMLVLACILAAPLIVNPTQISLGAFVEHFVLPGDISINDYRFGRILLTFFIVGGAVTLAVSGINFLVVVGALGAFICSPLFFILPGGMLCLAMRRNNVNNDGITNQTLDEALLINNNSTEEFASVAANEETSTLLFSSRERCAVNFISAWLVMMGIFTFFISVCKFIDQH